MFRQQNLCSGWKNISAGVKCSLLVYEMRRAVQTLMTSVVVLLVRTVSYCAWCQANHIIMYLLFKLFTP